MGNIDTYTEPDDVIITLELDDGSEIECVVLARFPLLERQYVALLPTDKLDDEEAEVFLYRFAEDEDGDVILDNIEDDDEFDAVRRSISAYLIMDRPALHYCDELHHGQHKRGQHRKAHSKSAEMLVDPGQQQT